MKQHAEVQISVLVEKKGVTLEAINYRVMKTSCDALRGNYELKSNMTPVNNVHLNPCYRLMG